MKDMRTPNPKSKGPEHFAAITENRFMETAENSFGKGDALLEIKDLKVSFKTDEGIIPGANMCKLSANQ